MSSTGTLKMSVRLVLAVAGGVLIGGLALAIPVAAYGSTDSASPSIQASTWSVSRSSDPERPDSDADQPIVAGGYGIDGRGPFIIADLVALASVAIGALALARATGRIHTSNGRTGAIVAMATGLTSMAIAGVALAIADDGPGTGNGVVGSALAIAIGLIGLILGWTARLRSRRTD